MSTALLNLLFAQTIYKYAAENESHDFPDDRKSDGSQSPSVQFVRLAEELKNHPLNSNFHLSPQACESLYNALLPNTPSGPTVDKLEPLLEKLFESYKRDVIQQIRRREQEYKSRMNEIEEIQQGKWDVELVKEYEQELKNDPDAPASQQQQLQQLRLQKQLELQQKQEQERKLQLQKQTIQKQKLLEKQQAKQEKDRGIKQDQGQDRTAGLSEIGTENEEVLAHEERVQTPVPEDVHEKRRLRSRISESPTKSITSPKSSTKEEEKEAKKVELRKDEEEAQVKRQKVKEVEENENENEKTEAELPEAEVEYQKSEEEVEPEIDEIDETEENDSADETDGDQSINEENKLKRKRESSTSHRRFQQLTTPLLTDISSNKSASFFLHPVNPNDAPNYYNLIKRPMDIRTIKSMVKSGGIRNSAELERDLQHMFANSIMYNDWDSDVAQFARDMQRDTDTLLTLFRHAEGGASTPGPDEDRKRRKK